MASYRGPRESLVQFIGILAASVASIGIHLSNNQFNGRMINKYACSELLKDEMVIRRFYLYETLFHHNFVVFQTDSGHTFKVHLIADVDPGRYSPIHVKIGPTYWRPAGKHVKMCNKNARDLKRFVIYEIRKFGTYDVGFNDCRHFARAVAAFLAR
jgi:hypothetical protein